MIADDFDLPLVEELPGPPDPEAAFVRFASRPHCVFLDSAVRMPGVGRYSFLAADPVQWLQFDADGTDALQALESMMGGLPTSGAPSDPAAAALPFHGGAAGLFSYDLGRSLEQLPRHAFDEFNVPALAIGLYDTVLAYDHERERAWLISQGWPAAEPSERHRRARGRIAEFRRLLDEPSRSIAPLRASRSATNAVPRLAPQYSVDQLGGLTSNFTPEQYRRTISRAVEYIYAGDVFQVNLAQRLLHPQADDSVSLYLRLRQRNPAPFAGYFDLGDYQLLSASPERFLSVAEGNVEARPIKGTRRRTAHPEADLFAGDDLLGSEKDRAENVMIVDLLRNDLARVCRPDSIQVTQLCGLETYQFVQHLVSAVRGDLMPDRTAVDLIRAAFPGGSITGAPKVRAMEIIAELEPTARGAYCGSLGYVGCHGQLDLSILIRTIIAGRGWWQFPVGGGITAQSDPQLEFEETWHKARGLVESLK